MTPPSATQPRIRSNHEDRGQRVNMPSVEALIRETHAILSRTGARLSPSKVARLCRDYVNLVAGKGVPFGTYLANAVALNVDQRHAFDEIYYRLSHADPTGESVARNVDCGRTALGGFADRLARAGGAR